MKKHSVPNILLIVAALAASMTSAQSSPPLPEGAFGETLDVRVINVEVVVTDRSGVRVRGLTPEMFSLFVDGEPQKIEYFTEVRGGIARPVADGISSLPEVQVPEVRPGTAVGTSYLVFVDEFFSRSADRDRVLDDLREQLGYLGTNDRMAVVAFDGRRVEMLSSWSQSVPALDDVLREAQRRPTFGLRHEAELRQLDRDQTPVGFRRPRSGDNYLQVDELYYAQQIEDQLHRSVSAAAATLRGFAAPPGRKVMLLLSGGWPNHPAEYVVNDYHRALLDTQVQRGSEIFRPLTDTANLLGYTLYPVDVPGFRGTDGLVDASLRNAPTGGAGGAMRETDVHQTLEFLAGETGGEAFINSGRLGFMETIHEDLAAYYWLGFIPQRAGSDEAREIEVRLSSPALRVRHREGFQDFSRSTEATMAVESALLFGPRSGAGGPSPSDPSAGGLSVEFGESKRAGIGKVVVPLAVTIPLNLVTLIPYGDDLVGEVELRIAVQDDDGSMAPVPVIPLRVTVASVPSDDSVDVFETSLKLRKAPHDLVVSVLDPTSGRSLMIRRSFEP
ncbi:MAG: VWA domain-containing protein [Thermoanaerobaculia bacterium]|nr:VWA domain-containing protein [Thermoanaerobaculia bacterium]